MNTIWHNGEWKNEDAAIFTSTDRIRLGDGIFDTLFIQNGYPQHLDKHFNRLKENAKVLSLDFKTTFERFETIVSEIIKRNNANEGSFALNTIISRGPASRGLSTPTASELQIILRIAPVPASFPEIRAHIVTKTRRNEGSALSQIKSCNYGDSILAMLEAESHGCNEAIMINNKGNVTCTSAANIFCIHGSKISTPPLSDGVLNGIARDLFMMRYDVIEKSITPDMLLNSESIFITNSIRGLQFIKSVNGQNFSESSLSFDKNFHISS